MNSRLFLGDLGHARLYAHAMAYRYRVHLMWLDLDELGELDRTHRWFGYNRKRLFSIFDRDYLGSGPGSIKDKFLALLAERNVSPPDGRILLLTGARYFNYAFNPVSFYCGFTKDNALHVAVAEVNNTMGEKHVYVLDDTQRIDDERGYRYLRDKAFHVSPFIDLAGQYDFRFRFPSEGFEVVIDLLKKKDRAFHAQLSGKFLPFTPDTLRRLLIQYPLTSFLTMTRILTQATKLYGRGATVYERPAPFSSDTIGRRATATRAPWYARFVLSSLDRLEHGGVDVHLPNGETIRYGQPTDVNPVQVHFTEWRAFSKILRTGDIGLGESFMNGDWTTNDLTGFLRVLVDNRDALASIEDGSRFRKVSFRFLSWLLRNNPRGSRRNISAHYDLSNDLFETFLDPSMTYSSAYFERADQSLQDAQEAKYRRLCDKINLKDGDHVLEVGCGWGGFACFAATYRRCHVTAVTISKEQYDYAVARIEAEGLSDRVNVVLEDYRSLQGAYDKIVSIEMFEAVGYPYYPTYFKTIERLLKPEGVFVMQAITMPDKEFHHYRKTYDWIRKYIFPGGLLASLDAINQTVARHTQLVVQDLENIGPHYATTLRHWRLAFNDQIDRVRELGFDVRFERMWNFYLAYCEAAFEAQYLGNLQLVFARPLRAERLPRV